MNSNEKQNKINQLKNKKTEIIDDIKNTISEADNIHCEMGNIKDYV